MRKINEGDILGTREWTTVTGAKVAVPDRQGPVHLQFRRFAGCVFCDLHLRSFLRRHADLVAAGVREVVVFRSAAAEVLEHHEQLPFALVADPHHELCREFGVGASLGAVCNPRAWSAALRGLSLRKPGMPRQVGAALGLPADFLIDPTGRVLACKYGVHAYDQWTVDDLLGLLVIQGRRGAGEWICPASADDHPV